MNEEEYAAIMNSQQLQQQLGQNAMSTQQQLMFQEQEKGLAEEQLDVEDIIMRIYNLILGKQLVDKGGGNLEWEEPKTKRLKILSEEGIQRIMQMIRFHINKNTLLSNYSIEEVYKTMYNFVTELNDLIFLKHKSIFAETTFEECKEIMERDMANRLKLKMFTYEVLGKVPDKAKLNKEMMEEMEGKIEKLMQDIKEKQLRERIKEYGILSWEIEQQVFSTLLRALRGEERGSLRRHANFSEVRSITPEIQKKGGLFGWSKG